jgi:hypothetical protein
MLSGYGNHRRQKIQYETDYQYPKRKSSYPFHIVLQHDCLLMINFLVWFGFVYIMYRQGAVWWIWAIFLFGSFVVLLA